ncbi:protein draper-like [Magallana gigas]|uniref:protein draper-like n=1 Tax=Magallana gigas TaxID=29159 RepID=UPI00148AC2C2|nr:cell death abnormality protein 1-like [Crassostrea gigas]
MDTQRIASVLLSYMYLIDIAASEDALCYNSKTAVYECCQDYKNVSGTCEACIGFWGKDCGNNCSYGYYGHGCRKTCNCGHQQICDPKQGCIACIGSWGKDCGKNCGYGYYGHGCRTKCNCSYQQICDPIQGCIADNSVDEPSNLTNCSDMEKVYNILTSAHGINICYNSMTEKIECCAGFTNITGICEKNVENFTEKVDFTTNNAGNTIFTYMYNVCQEYVNCINVKNVYFNQSFEVLKTGLFWCVFMHIVK